MKPEARTKHSAPDGSLLARGIYDAGFVQKLFDEMSSTYERVNLLSSFGFSRRWREELVGRADIRPGMIVCDLMCGAGECWGPIDARLAGGRLLALDFSDGMLRAARKRRRRLSKLSVTLLREDALRNTMREGCVDRIVCGFGIKTLSEEQREAFASEVSRLLKPGGRFSLVEVSVPRARALRGLYMFYLKRVIPIIGRLLLGNPENYRMLGVYTERFEDCRAMRDALARGGLQASYHDYFFGCASGVSGIKPRAGTQDHRSL